MFFSDDPDLQEASESDVDKMSKTIMDVLFIFIKLEVFKIKRFVQFLF